MPLCTPHQGAPGSGEVVCVYDSRLAAINCPDQSFPSHPGIRLHARLLAAVDQFLNQNADHFVDDLKELLRSRASSADSKYRGDVRKAAEWVHSQLQSAGLSAELVETPGHPIVYAEWLKKPGAPTVMVYGHYDVQPPDPLNEWVTPLRADRPRREDLRPRATDDKGQMLTHVQSVKAWLQAAGSLPVNVKFVIEGEEEVGSNNLENFLEARKSQLKCDVAVISDTSQYAPGIPAVTYGLRGIIAAQVTLHGPKQDLHSGVFGGSIANPVNALARGSSEPFTMTTDGSRSPGFYDDVQRADRRRTKGVVQRSPSSEPDLPRSSAPPPPGAKPGTRRSNAAGPGPTCDVNGIYGGYQEKAPRRSSPPGRLPKSPAGSSPASRPTKIVAGLKAFVTAHCRPGLRIEFQEYHGCPATVCDLNSPYMAGGPRGDRRRLRPPAGHDPRRGTIPVVGTFKKVLGVDTLLLGWGQNTDNLHGPNEHFSLDDYQRGIRSAPTCGRRLAAAKRLAASIFFSQELMAGEGGGPCAASETPARKNVRNSLNPVRRPGDSIYVGRELDQIKRVRRAAVRERVGAGRTMSLPRLDPMQELLLVGQAAGGDTAAFSVLVRACERRLLFS